MPKAWIVENARRAVALAALHGNLHIRAFADVDGKARLEGVKALIRVRDEFRGIVDLQVVAFAQDGIVREPGAADLMHQAMALGADVVGGIPWIEFTDADAAAHIRTCFDLAQEFNKDVSMLLDDAGDPGSAHAGNDGGRGDQARLAGPRARASLPRDEPLPAALRAAPRPRSADRRRRGGDRSAYRTAACARSRNCCAEGVRVCLGQDDISDAYYPFGRNNMLEVAFLASHLLWMMTRQDVATLYDMITLEPPSDQSRRFGLSVGAPANLVVLDQPDEVEALRYHGPPAHVISHGKLVDAAKMRAIVAAGAGPA